MPLFRLLDIVASRLVPRRPPKRLSTSNRSRVFGSVSNPDDRDDPLVAAVDLSLHCPVPTAWNPTKHVDRMRRVRPHSPRELLLPRGIYAPVKVGDASVVQG